MLRSLRRIPGLTRPLRPPNHPRHQPFTNRPPRLNLVSRSPNRPQLPFLSTQLTAANASPLVPLGQHFRRLVSTERGSFYKRGITKGLKWGVYGYAIFMLLHLVATGIFQEEIEQKWPTPPEWGWKSRWALRSAMALQHPQEIGKLMTTWPQVAEYLRTLIADLENPEKEGKGIQEQLDGGLLVEGVGRMGYDVSMKSEPWRRGYFQALMGAARAAENLDGWFTDRKQKIAAPAEYVVSESNPSPKPMPGGRKEKMLMEDCEPSSDPPETFYMKVLTTNGFTTGQKVEAALAYADWLDFKGLSGTARDMYNWAMDIAVSGLPFDPTRVIDPKTGVLKNNGKDVASENILRVSTALAVHYARQKELSTALSIFTSVLKARRALPESGSSSNTFTQVPRVSSLPFSGVAEKTKSLFTPGTYPEPPPDGNEPPVRGPGFSCEEAGLMTYIGEIIYASSSKESGLAWTRDAVDLAEMGILEDLDLEMKERCAQCLKVGLTNWKTMVHQLVVQSEIDELEARRKAETSWLGGDKALQKKEQERKRWQAEEIIVQERARKILPLTDLDEFDGLAPSSLF